MFFCFHVHPSMRDLHRSLCTYGKEKLSLEQAQDLVAQLEVDGNGLINYVEYVNMMMSST